MKALQQILACVMSLNLGKVNISASERYGGAHKCNHGIAYRQYAKDTYVSTCDRIWHALLKESRDLISALDTRQRSREWITRHVLTRTKSVDTLVVIAAAKKYVVTPSVQLPPHHRGVYQGPSTTDSRLRRALNSQYRPRFQLTLRLTKNLRACGSID